MKRKGFTLVELLAVIVILAVIALITIPIVLRTINHSEDESEKKSVEGYARAIEDDIANYLIEDPTHTYKKYNDEISLRLSNLDYKGNQVICTVVNVSDTGKVTLEDCVVTNKELAEEQKKKKKHYKYENGKVSEMTDSETQQVVTTAVQTLLSKTNGPSVTNYVAGSEESHQMYTFSHDATEQTEALTDYRYIGSDPYNYVNFNNEMWRIIGIFTVEDEDGQKEQRIKLIKDEKLTDDQKWDRRINGVGAENNWGDSELNTFLNNDYYNNELKSIATSMIEPAKYYLGVNDYDSVTHYGAAQDIYNSERGALSTYYNKSINWTGNVGLIYPSDYAYTYAYEVSSKCYNDINQCQNSTLLADSRDGWLYQYFKYQWTISPFTASGMLFLIHQGGNISWGWPENALGVRPVVYLKSSVQIISGTGTNSDPYQLKI